MGVESTRGGEKVQEGEHEQSQEELLREARYYLRRFGTSCVLESTSNDDLKYVWGKKSDMPPELFVQALLISRDIPLEKSKI